MRDPLPLDHIVVGCPDLAGLAAWFTARTGVEPAPGGRHVGWGTANLLVGLGGGAYLELVGPDPEQPRAGRPRPFGVDALDGPRVVTWAVRAGGAGPGIDEVVAEARDAGYDPGDPAPMSRAAPDGSTLNWQLTPPDHGYGDGLVPFVIDWAATPHPTTRALPRARLLDLRATHPDPASVRPALAALRADLRVDLADHATLAVTLDGAGGPVQLG